MIRRHSTHCLLLLLLAAAPATADISLVMVPLGGTDVRIYGGGSGTVSAALAGETQYDMADFLTDFLADSISSAPFDSTFVAGSLTNVTTGQTEALLVMFVDRDLSTDDDLGWRTAVSVDFSAGDAFRLSIDALFIGLFNPATDFLDGVHVNPGGGSADEIFGRVTLRVPEPSGLALAAPLALAAATRRRRRAPLCA